MNCLMLLLLSPIIVPLAILAVILGYVSRILAAAFMFGWNDV